VSSRSIAAIAFASCGLALAFGANAGGQPSSPSPEITASPRPTPAGLVGRAQLVVQAALGGAGDKLTLGGDIAFEQRGPWLRIDVLSIKIPGMNPVAGAVVSSELFPEGGFSAVYNRADNSYSIWSASSHKYYTGQGRPAISPTATPKPAATATDAPDLLGFFKWLAFIKDLQNLSLSFTLAGHGTTNGHPTTGIDYQFTDVHKDGTTSDVHGRVQFADDLDEFPVQLTASVKAKGVPEGALRLDLTTLERRAPALSDFRVPQGYARTEKIGEAIGRFALPSGLLGPASAASPQPKQ
jgi:hypothetical protein